MTRQLDDRAAATSWAWDEIRDRSYPAAVGVVLVYLAGKSAIREGRWVTHASHGELAAISGARIETVRGVMKRLYADGLVWVAPRELSLTRTQRALFIAVADGESDE